MSQINENRISSRVSTNIAISIKHHLEDKYIAAHLEDLSLQGAGISIDPQKMPVFHEGDKVYLMFHFFDDCKPVTTSFRWQMSREEKIHFGVLFKQSTISSALFDKIKSIVVPN